MSSTDGLSRRTLRLRAAFLFLLGAAVVAILVLLSAAGIVLIHNSHVLIENSDAAKEDRQVSSRSLRLLIECSTPPELRVPPEADVPESDCYVRNQDATAGLVAPSGPLSPLMAAAAACGAVHPGDYVATRDCMVKELTK